MQPVITQDLTRDPRLDYTDPDDKNLQHVTYGGTRWTIGQLLDNLGASTYPRRHPANSAWDNLITDGLLSMGTGVVFKEQNEGLFLHINDTYHLNATHFMKRHVAWFNCRDEREVYAELAETLHHVMEVQEDELRLAKELNPEPPCIVPLSYLVSEVNVAFAEIVTRMPELVAGEMKFVHCVVVAPQLSSRDDIRILFLRIAATITHGNKLRAARDFSIDYDFVKKYYTCKFSIQQ